MFAKDKMTYIKANLCHHTVLANEQTLYCKFKYIKLRQGKQFIRFYFHFLLLFIHRTNSPTHAATVHNNEREPIADYTYSESRNNERYLLINICKGYMHREL